MKLHLARKHIPIVATVAVFFALYLLGAALYWDRNFISIDVIINLLKHNAYLGITAVGMTFVILSGGIDLSVGAMVGFTSILMATLITKHGMHPVAVIPLAVAIGMAFGAVTGCIITFFRLPPFLVTLAGMFLARGMGLVISREDIGITHPMYAAVNDLPIPVPATALTFIAVLAAALYLAHYTRFGRNVYAIGGNEQSAVLMGLPVTSTKIRIYALSGLCSALAGVVSTFHAGSGDANAANMMELDAIASVVIGGTLLSGGVGYVAGTLVGVLILGLIQTLIQFEGSLSSWWTRIAVGVLLLGFILMQRLVQVSAARKRSGG